MDVNPNMTWLREELLKRGFGYEVDDSEDETVDGFVLHVDRTILQSRGGSEVTVIYVWSRNEDGEREGLSAGYPAYLECQVGDEEPFIASVDDVIARALE